MTSLPEKKKGRELDEKILPLVQYLELKQECSRIISDGNKSYFDYAYSLGKRVLQELSGERAALYGKQIVLKLADDLKIDNRFIYDCIRLVAEYPDEDTFREVTRNPRICFSMMRRILSIPDQFKEQRQAIIDDIDAGILLDTDAVRDRVNKVKEQLGIKQRSKATAFDVSRWAKWADGQAAQTIRSFLKSADERSEAVEVGLRIIEESQGIHTVNRARLEEQYKAAIGMITASLKGLGYSDELIVKMTSVAVDAITRAGGQADQPTLPAAAESEQSPKTIGVDGFDKAWGEQQI